MAEKVDKFVIDAGQKASDMREQILSKKVFDTSHPGIPQILIGTGTDEKVEAYPIEDDNKKTKVGILFGENIDNNKRLNCENIDQYNYTYVFRNKPLYLYNSLNTIINNGDIDDYKEVLKTTNQPYILRDMEYSYIEDAIPLTSDDKIVGQISMNNVTTPFYIENYQMKGIPYENLVGKKRHYKFTINYSKQINGKDIYEYYDSYKVKINDRTEYKNQYPYITNLKMEIVFDEQAEQYTNGYLKLYLTMGFSNDGYYKISFKDRNELIILYPIKVQYSSNTFSISRIDDGQDFNIPILEHSFSLIFKNQFALGGNLSLLDNQWNYIINKNNDIRYFDTPSMELQNKDYAKTRVLELIYYKNTGLFSQVNLRAKNNVLVAALGSLDEHVSLEVEYYESV